MFKFSEQNQKVVDIGMAIIQFGLCSCFSYWSSLNSNVKVLRRFNFLFISDFKALRRYYKKQPEPTIDREVPGQISSVLSISTSNAHYLRLLSGGRCFTMPVRLVRRRGFDLLPERHSLPLPAHRNDLRGHGPLFDC